MVLGSEGGEGEEGEDGLEEVGGEEEVVVAELEGVGGGEGGEGLAEEDGVGVADEVFGKLPHWEGGGDWAVVDGDLAVGADEGDSGAGGG